MNIICSTLNAKFIHTSLALRYLKAYAEPEFHIQLAEYTINDPVMNIVSDLYSKGPDVIGFSCYIWNIEETIKVIKMLKKIQPELIIVLGGPEVTYDTFEWMEKINEVDFIAIGEGESTFKSLLTEMSSTQDYRNVAGIAYRRNEEVIINPQREKLDLATIPSPYRFPEDFPNLSKRVVYIETSRGCPFTCQFCLSSIEVGVRYFNRDKIKEDILFLMEHGAKTLKFVDRTFNISRSYAMEMFQFLIDHHYPGTVFQFEITADIMRPEVLQFLNDHAPEGLFRFEIGIQSTNDYTNALVKRKQNFEKLTRTVQMVKEGGKIAQHLDLIAGLPEEDYDSFRKTFNDVFAFEPEELQLGFLKMLRGTGLRREAEKYGYIYEDHSPYEILGNNVLPFNDILRIKQVEDVLEKYWNAHRMDTTLLYLVWNVFDSPFDFFQEFGAYWDKKGWSRIGHQLEDLFERLFMFLSTKEQLPLIVIEAMMKYDYLISKSHKPRKPWWQDKFDKDLRSEYLKTLSETPSILGEEFVQLSLSEKDLHKHTIMEVIPFDIGHYLQTGSINNESTLMLIFYNPTLKKSALFTASLKNIEG
ncbi:B12-binding domain-containing radical SAM protein [Schinkia azotoformans]|uniref:B12-binding domain-containing radical SAM protein n=1 Tax=Schinkia azotoformans TaxID=1454 RepID=UPI002DBD2EEB|nr:B12-binding domain-containing radical SAM protein [Schinkia azotoformans]MEC1718256.1 B12-binding domain-containing radical SAM protein [Schinkia azotoformans]MEC1740277.1 B12-binding domain-containing radical SAM protein [Schinkia azotoformans]MEC1747157.1 B12-binding domain-containing radical SAM protein [Schinkia azotoformans]MEC1757440.1 B12-binding domain-containing radical SAM protein [Schinkia azotoformans]MEC1768990.1 B12-binding domain-containing radical SAM protein [Schinkia azoto